MTAAGRDDDLLETYLESDTELSRVYREGVRELPPTGLDARIVSEAHDALSSSGTRRAKPFPHIWMVPTSIAATVVLSAGLVYMVTVEQRAMEGPAPGGEALLQLPAEEFRAEHTGAGGMRLGDTKARADTARKRETSGNPGLMSIEPDDLANEPLAPSPTPESAAAGVGRSASTGLEVTGKESASPPAIDADRAAPTQDTEAMYRIVEEAQEMPLQITEEWLAYPKLWIDYISQLALEGRNDEARTQIKAFRSRHPDYSIPDELAVLARDSMPSP